MIDLDYTSSALWLGMNPAFLEHGQNRPWVPKQNQDSVWEKEGECDCCVDNYDAPFSKCDCWSVSLLQYCSLLTSNTTHLFSNPQHSQIVIIYYLHESHPEEDSSMIQLCSNTSPSLITPLLQGAIKGKVGYLRGYCILLILPMIMSESSY